MLEKIKYWFYRNHDAISWFLIGMLVSSGVTSLVAGHLFNAVLSFGFAFLNYIFVRK